MKNDKHENLSGSLLSPPQKDKKGRYKNPVDTPMAGFSAILRTLPRVFLGGQNREPKQTPGPFVTDPEVLRAVPANGLRVTWFGHSAMWLDLDGVRVLIDPVWDRRASPVQWFGPKRFFPPTIELANLPIPDVVLLSHDHYDHLGERTIRSLAALQPWREVRWVTSTGVGSRLRRFGIAAERITELGWTESADIAGGAGGSLRIDCWPARHFSGRGVGDRFRTLWSSWVLEGSRHRVYFGADSGPWEGFAEIGRRYEGFDLIMLEIGAYDRAWGTIHLGPDQAAEAFVAMRDAAQRGGHERPGFFMPIHWGLFNLALHAWRQPMERLTALATERDLRLWSPRQGLPSEVTEPLVDDWWRG